VAPLTADQLSSMSPVLCPAPGLRAVAESSTGAAVATSTVALRALSVPVKLSSTGVTLYCHEPYGTSSSMHCGVAPAPAIVEEQPALGVTASALALG
jgi:hypothetical protein